MEKSEKRFIEQIRQKASAAISYYKLINNGDKILIGVSGGKDSLALIDILYSIKKHKKIDFEIYASHIKVLEIQYQSNFNYLNSFCESRGVKFIYRNINVDFNLDKKKSNCFVCSWSRRKELFHITRELNCNKIALGHHRDDANETLILNMVYHGSICSMPARLKMFNNDIEMIRPLITLSNSDLKKYSKILDFTLQEKNCPYENATKRKQINSFIHQISKQFPEAHNNIFNSMTNIYSEYLPNNDFYKD